MSRNSSFDVIENIDFTQERLPEKNFEQVTFQNCRFSDLSRIEFLDCTFVNCDLSNTEVNNTRFSDVTFEDCKLTGVHFSKTRDFLFAGNFANCIFDYAVFDGKKLNKSMFSNCRLQGVDFGNADISKSVFNHCDFIDAIFDNTNAAGVDFRGNVNFTINPARNNIKKAKFLSSDLAGLLRSFDIIIK